MKVKLLKNKVTVTVKPIRNQWPDCSKAEYCPIKEPEFEALATAVWFEGSRTFLAVTYGNTRLIIPDTFVNLNKTQELYDNMEANYLSSLADVRRYGMKEFASDVLMMSNDFDVVVSSVSVASSISLSVEAEFKWQLHGIVKPVKCRQYVCFSIDDSTDILVL